MLNVLLLDSNFKVQMQLGLEHCLQFSPRSDAHLSNDAAIFADYNALGLHDDQ